MKKWTGLFLMIVLTVSLSGCGAKTVGEADTPKSEQAGEDEPEDSEIDWEVRQYTGVQYTYEVPADWEEIQEMTDGTGVQAFFTKSSADLDAQPSNVIVEVLRQLTEEQKGWDYTDTQMQESFYEYVKTDLLKNRPGVSNTEFSVLETVNAVVYVVDMERETDSGKTAHQTWYFPMGMDYSIILYATDLGDGIVPDVKSVAEHIIETMEAL